MIARLERIAKRFVMWRASFSKPAVRTDENVHVDGTVEGDD